MMPMRLSDGMIRLFALVFGFCIAAIAVAVFIGDIRAQSIRDSALRLEEGSRINEAALLGLNDNRALRRAQESCRNVTAAVIIRKQAVDQIDDFADPSHRDAALDALYDTLQNALACFPLEGRHWLSFAQSRLQLVGPDSAMVDALRIARATRPGESDALADRIVVVSWLYDAGIDAIEDLLRADLGLVLRYQDLDTIEEFYAGAGMNARRVFERELKFIPDERRTRIEQRVRQLNARLTEAPYIQ